MGMFSSSKKLRMPSPDEALPGRATAMRLGDTHFVNGHKLTAPFPDGLARAVFGLGCFWGAERKFWQTQSACMVVTAVGYAGRPDAEPDLRGGVLGRAPATTRWCWWYSMPS